MITVFIRADMAIALDLKTLTLCSFRFRVQIFDFIHVLLNYSHFFFHFARVFFIPSVSQLVSLFIPSVSQLDNFFIQSVFFPYRHNIFTVKPFCVCVAISDLRLIVCWTIIVYFSRLLKSFFFFFRSASFFFFFFRSALASSSFLVDHEMPS